MSTASSDAGSPGGSYTDLRDETYDYENRSRRRRGSKKHSSGIDLDDVEFNLRKCQQESADCDNDMANIKSQTGVQARKIHDLALQFEEARIRLDKLLNRKSRSHSEVFSIDTRRISVTTRMNIRKASTDSGGDGSQRLHKTSVTVNPNQKQVFAPVSLTVHVDE